MNYCTPVSNKLISCDHVGKDKAAKAAKKLAEAAAKGYDKGFKTGASWTTRWETVPSYFNPGGPLVYSKQYTWFGKNIEEKDEIHELSLAEYNAWHKGFRAGLQNPLHSVCNGWLSEHGRDD